MGSVAWIEEVLNGAVVGVAGAALGGLVASFWGLGSVVSFDPAALMVAGGGAIFLLLAYRKMKI